MLLHKARDHICCVYWYCQSQAPSGFLSNIYLLIGMNELKRHEPEQNFRNFVFYLEADKYCSLKLISNVV